MSSVKSIKQRIRSVKNTRQITKAMEVVSATKMRRSQGFALDGRPYALAALEILGNIMSRSHHRSVLMQDREIKRALVVVITSDKGLAGAFSSNVIKRTEGWIKEHSARYPVDVAVVGRKARDYMAARKENVIKDFVGFGDYALPGEVKPLSDFLIHGFEKYRWGLIEIVYTHFRSTLKQEVMVSRLFPVNLNKIRETIDGIIPEYGKFSEKSAYSSATNQRYNYEYKFEPSPEAVFDAIIPHLIEMQIFHMILESNASEHSARMVAMKNASENAKEIISELTLEYNKSRQSGITKELTEITAGKEALAV